MYRCFSWVRHGRGSSLVSLFANKPSLPSNPASRAPPSYCFYEHGRRFSSVNLGWIGRNLSEKMNVNDRPDFMRNKEKVNTQSNNDVETQRSSRPMDFVRGVVEEHGRKFMGGSRSSQQQYATDADFVHIKMLRNNTFVTVTDSKGNVKLSGSAGSLKEMKTGQKLSRYAAEATAEVVGRRARPLGLKSVVMKVKGFTHFRRKRQAILSWREGFADSRGDRNPIVYVEDTTRRAHNGCRLPKKRRI